MDNEFRKDKLNNGCIVQLRTGDKYIYLVGAKINGLSGNMFINIKTGAWRSLEEYDDNLRHLDCFLFDILKFCNMDYVGENWIKHIIDNTDKWTAVREENEEECLKEIMEEIRVETEELMKL